MNVIVRQAAQADLNALIELNGVVQSLHAQLEPSLFRENVDQAELRTFFAEVLTRPDSYILIAEDFSKAVGYMWFDYQERPETPFTHARTRIYIQHIVVGETVRRAGVGSALMEAVEAEARARSVHRLVLDAWALNGEAQSFFEARKFRAFNIVLDKNLA
ncbi:MAG: GNAT family N-acetyltransferase [Caulobacteraceae bacterium]